MIMKAICGAIDDKFIVKIIGGPLAHTRFSSRACNNTLYSHAYIATSKITPAHLIF